MSQNDEPKEIELGQPADAVSADVPVTPPATPTDAPQPPESETVDETVEPQIDETRYQPNAKEDLAIRSERPANRRPVDLAQTITLLYTTVRGAAAALSSLENIELPDPANAGKWVSAIQNADQFSPLMDDHAGFAAWRDNATWRQFVEHEGVRLRVGVPKLADMSNGQTLSGDAAIRRVQQRMSLGTHLQWPLWNSGIWVTFVPPMEEAILELQERIQQEKISLGRATRGAVFDNYQVYIVDHVMRFAYDHISAVTLKPGAEGLETALDNHILVSDIPNLLMGLLCTIYPNGYDFTQPCTADITKCTAIFEGMISLSKMYWADTSRLNESQRRLMARRKTDSVTSEEILKYQSEFAEFEGSTIELRDGINVTLQMPTLATYRDSGRRWVDGIDRDAQEVFGKDLRGREREDYMYRQAVLSTLQAYSHWYKHIVIQGAEGEDDQYIEDRTTLERLAKTLSSDTSVVSKLDEGIKRFNDQATCTIVGIVNFTCPKCNQTQLRPDAPNQVIIPVDVVSTFFTLLSNRLTQILTA